MGVTGLWGIVDSVGHPVNLETLHNKVIAIDLSLWVNQSIKGFRGRNGQTVDNAHVLGLFHRVCKLLFYKIKPVFVFDGTTPQLKRNTIAKRAERRLKAVDKSRESALKVLTKYLSSQLPPSSAKQIPRSDSLPSLESSLHPIPDNHDFKVYEELNELERDKELSDSDNSDSDSESDPIIAHTYRNIQNLDSIDINSDDFKALPLDVRYEILTELKQKYKGYRNTELMPKESNDFSKYQMLRLLKKRSLQSKIEETISQLNGQNSEDIIANFAKNDFVFESDSTAGRLMSDETTRFIFLKKSQTSSSKITDEDNHINSNTTKVCENITSTLVSKTESTDNLCIDILDSSDCEELAISSEVIKCDNFVVNIESNFKSDKILTGISSDSKTQETIQISDESDVENDKQLIEISLDKNELNNKSCDKLQTNDTNCMQNVIKLDESMRFTKIKAIEVNTDSDEDGFEEVGPLTTDAMSPPNTEPLNVKESVGLSQTDRVGTEEECVDGIDENKTHLNTEINSLADEDSLSDIPEETLKGLEPSPSKSSTHFESISREELINSYREVNNQNRLTNHTTDQMMSDCQELLRLFGIPFILSPTEAEAQCAALELLGLTDGTITDDSDVLLFGAQNVYKNFFTESKFVELFTAKDIETRFGLTRSSMICIALLCGSDYTDGVDGVGAVTATEILSEFLGDELKPLLDLKDWLTTKHNSTDKRPDNKIREKFLKIKVNDSFPNRVIFDAYMNPMVDKSEEKFLWAMPQLEELRRYASTRFGWTQTKTDSILLPVLKKVNEKQTQQTIDGYFKVQVQPKETALLSKRLSKAINKLRGKESEPAMSASTSSKTSQLTNKVKNQRKKRPTNVNTNKVNSKSKKRKTNTRTQTPKELTLSETSSDSD